MLQKDAASRGQASTSAFVPNGTLFVVCLVALMTAAVPLSAQSTMQLTVTLAVQSSISITFQNNPAAGTTGYCSFLSGNGTNAAALDLGTADFPSGTDTKPCVLMQKGTPSGAFYQVSSSFDVVVQKSNSSSGSYRLAAQLSTAPPTNVVWLLNNQTLTTTSTALTADAANSYGTAKTKTLQIQVKNNVAAGTLSETITFLATAN